MPPPPIRQRTTTRQTVLMVALVVVSLFAVVAVVRPRPPAKSRPVVIATSQWLPYVSPTLPDDGPMAKLVSQVMQRTGYEPEFTFTSWSLAQQQVHDGGALAVMPMVRSAEREERFYVSDPLVDFRYVLFFHRDRRPAQLERRTELHGIRVGRIQGYDYWAELDRSGAQFTSYATAESAFAALRAGEVDLVAEGQQAGVALVRGDDFAGDVAEIDFVRGTNPLLSSDQGLQVLFRKTAENKELMSRFNRALREFRQTEEYRRIVDQLEPSLDRIELVGEAGTAVGVLDSAAAPAGVAPVGTRAVVLQWPDKTALEPDDLVRVKFTNGPLIGQVRQIRVRDLKVVSADGEG